MGKTEGNGEISRVQERVEKFCAERDWGQFHGAKDLAIGLITEASELLEIFRFKSEDEIREMFKNSSQREKIEDEISDVFFFLLRFSGRHQIDLLEAFEKKMQKTDRA